jgi:hypothetical protein
MRLALGGGNKGDTTRVERITLQALQSTQINMSFHAAGPLGGWHPRGSWD